MNLSGMYLGQIMSVKHISHNGFCGSRWHSLVFAGEANVFQIKIRDISERYAGHMNKFEKANSGSAISNLLLLYDKIESDIQNQRRAVCAKGCSYCCSADFHISIIEFFYILNYIGINFGAEFVKSYSEQAKNSVLLSERCFFVDYTSGVCKIYEVRPIICRKYGVYKDCTDCAIVLNDKGAAKDLADSKIDTQTNVNFFKLEGKPVFQTPKPLIYWFSQLTDGEFNNAKMQKLFSAAFGGTLNNYVKILCGVLR